MNLIRLTLVCLSLSASLMLVTTINSNAADSATKAVPRKTDDGVLVWGNGDSLHGQLVSAKGKTLIWKSPLFADPLSVDLSVLSTVQFSPQATGAGQNKASDPEENTADEFCITLDDYTVLFGRLVGVDDDSYRFKSVRHGDLVLKKRRIHNLQRTQNQGLVYLGPRGLEGWDHKAVRGDWQENPDGSLTAPKGEATLTRNLSLPDKCELEFQIASSKIPDFAISVGTTTTASCLKFEVWDDAFVIRDAKRFVPLGTLEKPPGSLKRDPDYEMADLNDIIQLQPVPPGSHQLNFHGFIDFTNNVVSVYSQTGRKLGQLEPEDWSAMKRKRISIEAIDSDLTLRHVRIREWDGSAPPTLMPYTSRIHLQDGTLHYGEVTGFQAGKLTFAAVRSIESQPPGSSSDGNDDVKKDATTDKDDNDDDESAAKTAKPNQEEPEIIEFALDDVARIVLVPPAKPDSKVVARKTKDTGNTVVSWHDGGFVSGQLLAMDQESITMRTDLSSQPIRSTLAAVRRIALPNTDTPNEEPDRLFFDGGSLRGKLTVEDHKEPIRWTPVGGQNASALVSAGKARFQRGAEPEDSGIDSAKFPDIIYLHDGDVFPCHIESGDLKTLAFDTPVADLNQLSTGLIKAVEFGGSERIRHRGFGDNGWKKIRGSAKLGGTTKKDQASFSSASFGHDSILTGDSVSFRMQWKSNAVGNVIFHLYADSSKPTESTIVNLAIQPNQIIVSDRAANPNNGMFFGGVQNVADSGAVRLKKREVDVEFITRDGKLRVSINGKDTKAFDLNSNGVRSRRLVVNSMVSTVNNRGGQTVFFGDKNLSNSVEIDKFVVRNVVGASVKQFIQEEARDRALTVPRFRRDDPSTHVILAPNGDLLRGRLKSLTATEIVFESRLETFRFPRKRVSAVISLAEQTADAPTRADTAVQATLDNGYTLTMTPDRMADGQLVGTSRQLGPCRIPAKSIRDLFLGSPEGREEILSYVRWIRREAAEPEWDIPKDEEATESEMVGQAVEDFELPTLNGDAFRLSDHTDKVVVLDFWATWCGPCVAALPEYITAVSEFDESRVIFVAVNLEETPERIKDFLKRRRISPTVAMDRGSVIAKRFGVESIPHSVILGPGGVVKHVTIGYQPGVGKKTGEHISQLLKTTADKK